MTERAELEAQIAAVSHDDTPMLVYRDWLLQRGEARGELIAIDDAARRARAGEHAIWRRRRGELIARHPELIPHDHEADLEWHLGFVRRLVVRSAVTLPALIEHPALAFLQAIVIEGAAFRDDVLAILARPSLRSIAFGDPDEPRWTSRFGESVVELDPILAALPSVEYVSSRFALHTSGGDVRSLDLGVVARDTLPMLSRAQLPHLEQLALQFSLAGWRAYPPHPMNELEDLRAMIAAPPPALTVLTLTDVPHGDDVIAALVGSTLLRRLRRLRLWSPGLSVAGARQITRDAFGHLELLEVADPLLDDDSLARLTSACAKVRTISPRMREILGRDR